MPRRPPLVLALGALLLAGCSGDPNGVPAPAGVSVSPINGLSASTLVACRGLRAALPESLGQGLTRRAVVPASDSTSAYGDPVVAIRCGVEPGSDRDDPYTINDVRWGVHDTGATRTWTTLGRKVSVEVVVPDAYAQQAEIVGSVSFAVKQALKG